MRSNFCIFGVASSHGITLLDSISNCIWDWERLPPREELSQLNAYLQEKQAGGRP